MLSSGFGRCLGPAKVGLPLLLLLPLRHWHGWTFGQARGRQTHRQFRTPFAMLILRLRRRLPSETATATPPTTPTTESEQNRANRTNRRTKSASQAAHTHTDWLVGARWLACVCASVRSRCKCPCACAVAAASASAAPAGAAPALQAAAPAVPFAARNNSGLGNSIAHAECALYKLSLPHAQCSICCCLVTVVFGAYTVWLALNFSQYPHLFSL